MSTDIYSLETLLPQLLYHALTLALHLPQGDLHHLLKVRLHPDHFKYVQGVRNLVGVA